jgi:hypothetical protein
VVRPLAAPMSGAAVAAWTSRRRLSVELGGDFFAGEFIPQS